MLTSPSKYVKSKGLPSLQYVSEMSSISVETLKGWHKNRFARFDVVVAGCAYWHSKGIKPCDIKNYPNNDRHVF